MKPKIKVCGITQINQLAQLANLNIDFVGFIGYKKSPRYAWDKLNYEEVATFNAHKKVGVFVNENPNKILDIVDKAKLNLVQLHGREPLADIKSIAKEIATIKVISVAQSKENLQENLDELTPYIDFFLFDTASKNYGGTGKQFDWSILNQLIISKPYFLAGGIAPTTIYNQNYFNAMPYALDINSKFETDAGIKSIEMIKQFLTQFKENE